MPETSAAPRGLEETIIDVAPHRWRVLTCGSGPNVLCLHGAGASADSFLPLMKHLSPHMRLIAPDLPGHGGTRLGSKDRSGLEQMAADLATLKAQLCPQPRLTIGHSAGAALALAMNETVAPAGHVLINAALGSFEGLAGFLFPAMAKGLSSTPFAAEMLSRGLSDRKRLRRLLDSTGSTITDEIQARYAILVDTPDHIRGTLRMMAAWNLQPLLEKSPDIDAKVLMIVGQNDQTVPISVSRKASRTIPDARLVMHDGGHLLHEESPEIVADDILTFLASL